METTVNSFRHSMSNERINRLVREMQYALKKTDKKTVYNWGIESGKYFLKSIKKRGTNLFDTVKSFAKAGVKETIEVVNSAKEGDIKNHLTRKSADVKSAIVNFKENVFKNVETIACRVKDDPLCAGPELLVALIGFYLGSGGLDGDGGIPDLDLEMGIGAHRSIWFHSIVPGAIVEAATFSLAILVNSIHSNLPSDHDYLWDNFLKEYNRLSVAFASGTCAGLAYHLMVDATWDAGKAYSDLPFSTTMEGHQAIMGANAIAEGVHANGIIKNTKL